MGAFWEHFRLNKRGNSWECPGIVSGMCGNETGTKIILVKMMKRRTGMEALETEIKTGLKMERGEREKAERREEKGKRLQSVSQG